MMANSGKPSYTARPGEAILVFRNDNGDFEIGIGRIKIAPGDIRWVTEVVGDLGRIVHTQEGEEVLRQGDATGHPVTIRWPEPPTDPPNAWILPDDLVAAAAEGTGTGCGSTIVYNPADWPRRGDPHTPSSNAVLLIMLRQANLNAAGRSNLPVIDYSTQT